MTVLPFPSDHADYDAQAVRSVQALSDDLGRTVCIARILVENGRTIDLTGLEHGIGLLCAKALDLPADAGRIARDHLVSLLAETTMLTMALKAHTGSGTWPLTSTTT